MRNLIGVLCKNDVFVRSRWFGGKNTYCLEPVGGGNFLVHRLKLGFGIGFLCDPVGYISGEPVWVETIKNS